MKTITPTITVLISFLTFYFLCLPLSNLFLTSLLIRSCCIVGDLFDSLRADERVEVVTRSSDCEDIRCSPFTSLCCHL